MKFLVIGLGSIGTKHAHNLRAMGYEVFVYDPPLGYEKIKTVGFDIENLDAEGLDAAVICTPTTEHLYGLCAAIGHDKHVFVEKPIADKPDGVAEILAEAKRKNLIVAMGNNLRFHPSCRIAKRYIMEGTIGNPIWASIVCAQYNDRPQYRRDGVSLNWGAHELDLALWLLGPAEVSAASIDKADTVADICLAHESGCRSVVHLDYLTEPEMRQTVVVGDKGRMVVSLTGRYVALQRGDRGHPPEQQGGSWDEDYINEMIAFVGAIQDDMPWLGATGEDGLATLKLIDDARKMAGMK